MRYLLCLVLLLPVVGKAQLPMPGMTAHAADAMIDGKFVACDTAERISKNAFTTVAYAPYYFHGLPGILLITRSTSDSIYDVIWEHTRPVEDGTIRAMMEHHPLSEFGLVANQISSDASELQYWKIRKWMEHTFGRPSGGDGPFRTWWSKGDIGESIIWNEGSLRVSCKRCWLQVPRPPDAKDELQSYYPIPDSLK